MLVRDWMSRKVVTLDAGENMQAAIKLMTEHHVAMLPVMEDGKLVGIVTDRDLKRAGPSQIALLEIKQVLYHLSRVELRSIMTLNPITVPDDFTVEETAQVLLENNISGCPVVDANGKLVGCVSKNDLFRAMIAVSGLTGRGVQFGLLLEDRPGSIKEVADIMRKYGARIVSIMSCYEGAPRGHRFAYIRVFNVDRQHVGDLKTEIAAVARILYIVDLKENKREFMASP